MRRLLLAALLVVGLVATATASADHLDPKKRLTKADTARAKAMLLRKADLGSGVTTQPSQGGDPHLTCEALDESDLTLTGEAETPNWAQGLSFVTSASGVYATRPQAEAAWKRGTSTAGIQCLRTEFRREFARQSIKLISLRKISFPKLAQRTAAYRLALSGTAQGQTIRIFADFVVLMHSRAQAGLVLGTALVPPNRADEVALARKVAARMATAMRGA